MKIYEARKKVNLENKEEEILDTSILRYYLLKRFSSEILNWEATKVEKLMIIDEISTLAENERMKKIERGMRR